jgi:choline dehydrogenase
MGPESDESAVVDEYCRVRGVRNLRVVDISVIPTLMTRGPNATAIMLGERAAEFIAGASSTPDPLRDTS